ncbi:MAG: cell division protein SepF [Oscillospiraceae bacterium]|nr:cell division protein SepF [Ruminococcus sp.]MDE5991807.1 cell division protein SepF [Oscillospiraceae bacterium]MDE7301867.1 cell division protein SepF [Oscillospiraceae bacterium]
MSFIGNLKEILGMDTEDDNENDLDTFDNLNDNYDDEVSKRNKVVNIHATAQLQVILVKPEVFQDTKQIADHLNSKKTVVLNLESTTPDVTRRIIDFLGGVAYANGGNIKPVANNTFIITPYNVGFVGEDLVGELENNGVFL